jgi:hypothetical protein
MMLMRSNFAARKVSRAWVSGHDLELETGDHTLRIEVKERSNKLRTVLPMA